MSETSEFILPYESFASFQKVAEKPITITLIRGHDVSFPFSFRISDDFEEAYIYAKKILLSLLWSIGGCRFLFCCDPSFFSRFKQRIEDDEEAKPSFEAIEGIYGEEVSLSLAGKAPAKKEKKKKRFLSSFGSRVGLDLGGTDIKAMALLDGEVVHSSEIPWAPKQAQEHSYHEAYIRSALLEASSYLERVDSVGISTSGVVGEGTLIYPSLFASCGEKDKKERIPSLLKELSLSLFPAASFNLINDGDASAIGASLLYGEKSVLGLSLGTSLAGGYIQDGFLPPYLNELSKVPVNFSPSAGKHYQLGIRGSSSEYLSQKGIVTLAGMNAAQFGGSLPESLSFIQRLAEKEDKAVLRAYREFGKRLGSSVLYFSLFFDFSSVFLLGRVLSGKGGEALLESARGYLKSKGRDLKLFSADEKFKRLGQAYVAACLEK